MVSVVHRVDDHLVVLAQPERSLVAEVVVDVVLDLKLFRWHVLWLYQSGVFLMKIEKDVYHDENDTASCYS